MHKGDIMAIEKKKITRKKKVVKKKEIKKSVIKETFRDRIPNISGMIKVTLYAYTVGMRGFRFSTTPPLAGSIAWQKELTGSQAVQFLRGIKSRNKHNRMEANTLPVE